MRRAPCFSVARCVSHMCRHVQAATADILHLTEVNPYVASTLGGAFSAHLPRQISGSSQLGRKASTSISGFAFQGTNAHVILGRYSCNISVPLPSNCGDPSKHYAEAQNLAQLLPCKTLGKTVVIYLDARPGPQWCRKAQSVGSATRVATALWQRKRHWYSPRAHMLLVHASLPVSTAAEGGTPTLCIPCATAVGLELVL